MLMTDFNGTKTAVALGTFDGLHKGHMSVINKAVAQRSNGLLPVILMFSEHPLKVLTGKAPKELFDGRIKEREITKTGCTPYTVSFEEIRNMSPEEFVTEILIKKLNADFISCGFNFRFAKNGMGNTEILSQLCKKYKIDLEIAQEVDFGSECISSTRIRNAIENGDTETANKMLGRRFSYDFEVVGGDHRGRVLGFPTINQFFTDNFVIPKYGVYASATLIDGKWYPSVTNIGIRPTIGNSKPRSETCILGFSGDLYGTNTEVALISYIRPEIKFNDLEALTEQMKKDSEKAITIFNPEE